MKITEEKDKYPNAETVICDRQGYYHSGYYCRRYCAACPYLVEDIEGRGACYAEQYERCDKY